MFDIGIISGYFSPLHLGHIEYINAAKNQSCILVVIVNNDYQVKLKKSIPFMDELHRCNIINSIKGVDCAIISTDVDKTVCKTIKYIRSLWPEKTMAFFNSGDRTKDTIDSSEKIVCKENNIEFILLNQPKIYSSSELLSASYKVQSYEQKRTNTSISC
jgi:D-beta-D-heptose 7-phosphate kinase/D-beta-D-heptose 1-phosphate adenosyltransferase